MVDNSNNTLKGNNVQEDLDELDSKISISSTFTGVDTRESYFDEIPLTVSGLVDIYDGAKISFTPKYYSEVNLVSNEPHSNGPNLDITTSEKICSSDTYNDVVDPDNLVNNKEFANLIFKLRKYRPIAVGCLSSYDPSTRQATYKTNLDDGIHKSMMYGSYYNGSYYYIIRSSSEENLWYHTASPLTFENMLTYVYDGIDIACWDTTVDMEGLDKYKTICTSDNIIYPYPDINYGWYTKYNISDDLLEGSPIPYSGSYLYDANLKINNAAYIFLGFGCISSGNIFYKTSYSTDSLQAIYGKDNGDGTYNYCYGDYNPSSSYQRFITGNVTLDFNTMATLKDGDDISIYGFSENNQQEYLGNDRSLDIITSDNEQYPYPANDDYYYHTTYHHPAADGQHVKLRKKFYKSFYNNTSPEQIADAVVDTDSLAESNAFNRLVFESKHYRIIGTGCLLDTNNNIFKSNLNDEIHKSMIYGTRNNDGTYSYIIGYSSTQSLWCYISGSTMDFKTIRNLNEGDTISYSDIVIGMEGFDKYKTICTSDNVIYPYPDINHGLYMLHNMDEQTGTSFQPYSGSYLYDENLKINNAVYTFIGFGCISSGNIFHKTSYSTDSLQAIYGKDNRDGTYNYCYGDYNPSSSYKRFITGNVTLDFNAMTALKEGDDISIYGFSQNNQ